MRLKDLTPFIVIPVIAVGMAIVPFFAWLGQFMPSVDIGIGTFFEDPVRTVLFFVGTTVATLLIAYRCEIARVVCATVRGRAECPLGRFLDCV